MYKLFRLKCGTIEHYGCALTLEDMEKKAPALNELFTFLPVDISEIELEGFSIIPSEIVSPAYNAVYVDSGLDDEETTCPDCGQVFKSPNGMRTHRRLKHE